VETGYLIRITYDEVAEAYNILEMHANVESGNLKGKIEIRG
jgi:hypothetical protein